MKQGFVRNQRCPKCGGNVYLDKDCYGWYEECLQCGFTTHMKPVAVQQKINETLLDKHTTK